MPTYEFRCPNGHAFDKFYRSMSAAEMEVPCPECAEIGARQISGGAGLVFKGSGFYLTDYGKNAHRGDAKPSGSESKSDAGSASSGDSKSESKSEGKSDSKSESKGDSKSGGTTSSSNSSAPAPAPAPSKPSSSKGE